MWTRNLSVSCVAALLGAVLVLLVCQASTAGTSAGPIPLEGGWIDEFSDPTLNSRWQWVREDNSHWSLGVHPGFLRITTQAGSLFGPGGSAKNVLITAATLADFQIETKVTFSPTENYQGAELLIYQDDDNYVQIGRRHADGDKVRFRIEVEGIQSGIDVAEAASTVWLRIVKFNDLYVGSYSTDGNDWTEVARRPAPLSNPKVGITANGGPSSSEIPADFDYFQFSELAPLYVYVAPGGNCGGATPCFATVQAAVDAAGDLDLIRVAAGTYSDVHVRPRNDSTTTGFVTQVVYLTKTLTIEGGYTTTNWMAPDPEANPTTLDAQGKGRVVYITGDIHPAIKRLHITGGDATGLGGEPSNPTDAGGGVYIWKALATLSGNRVFSNTAETGGGIYVTDPDWSLGKPGPTLMGNTIFSNTADSGGGLALTGSTANVSDNLIRGNYASTSGGGVHSLFGRATIQRNIITANNACHGGGGYIQWSNDILTNNVIADNHIPPGCRGSGLHNQGGSPHLSHNTIARNTGGDGCGVYVVDLEDWGRPAMFITNTILANQPVGLHANGISTVTINGILWYDTPITVTRSTTAVVTVQNQYTGDPAFAADGYHLTVGSAAIDRGMDAGVTTDIDGDARPAPLGTRPDLGADEVNQRRVYLPLILRKQ